MKVTAGQVMKKASQLGWRKVKRGQENNALFFEIEGKRYTVPKGGNILNSIRELAVKNEYSPAGEMFAELYWNMVG